MRLFNQVSLQTGLPVGRTASAGQSGQARTRALSGCLAALPFLVASPGSVVTTSALAAGASPGTGQIAFYGDLGNDFGSQGPFLRDASSFLVRPSSVLLTEDGSADLEDLRWTGWGTSVARASGVWSASDGIPNMASGKRTKRPASLTLTSPGIVLGHLVYRCFRIDVPHPPRDIVDKGCLHRTGTYQQRPYYGYQ